jgi:hypothetical protein
VAQYADRTISFTLGSAYVNYYYPHNIYRLNAGDTFTVHVKGAACGGTVHFSGAPIPGIGKKQARPSARSGRKALGILSCPEESSPSVCCRSNEGTSVESRI